MKEYQDATVECKKIICNPCALDEYEVTIRPTNGKPEYVTYTYGSLFESNEAICDRIYRQWIKASK